MEFILTYRTDNSVGYGTTVIQDKDLVDIVYDYNPEDIISIVRVF